MLSLFGATSTTSRMPRGKLIAELRDRLCRVAWLAGPDRGCRPFGEILKPRPVEEPSLAPDKRLIPASPSHSNWAYCAEGRSRFATTPASSKAVSKERRFAAVGAWRKISRARSLSLPEFDRHLDQPRAEDDGQEAPCDENANAARTQSS